MVLSLIVASALLASSAPERWVLLVEGGDEQDAPHVQALHDEAKRLWQENADSAWVAPPQVSLADAQLALGCLQLDSTCLGQIGTMMKADVAVHVKIGDSKERTEFRMHAIDVTGTERIPVTTIALQAQDLRDPSLVRAALRAYLSQQPFTVLKIYTDLPHVAVSVDGTSVGEAPVVLINDLPPGSHELQLRAEGRAPILRSIELKAGSPTTVEAPFGANPIAPVRPRLGEEGARIAPEEVDLGFAFSVLGTGVALSLVSGGIYLGHALYTTGVPAQSTPSETQVQAAARLGQAEQVSIGLYAASVTTGIIAAVVTLTGAGLLGMAVEDGVTPVPVEAPAQP